MFKAMGCPRGTRYVLQGLLMLNLVTIQGYYCTLKQSYLLKFRFRAKISHKRTFDRTFQSGPPTTSGVLAGAITDNPYLIPLKTCWRAQIEGGTPTALSVTKYGRFLRHGSKIDGPAPPPPPGSDAQTDRNQCTYREHCAHNHKDGTSAIHVSNHVGHINRTQRTTYVQSAQCSPILTHR